MVGMLAFSSVTSYAQDMSRTETVADAYVDTPDGGSKYVGHCTTHDDYDHNLLSTLQVIQKYQDLQNVTPEEVRTLISKVDSKLLRKVLHDIQAVDKDGHFSTNFKMIYGGFLDDITIETIADKAFPSLNLIRFNVGVGGGNGIIVTYRKHGNAYRLVSQIMDGDVQFCDKAVWSESAHPGQATAH